MHRTTTLTDSDSAKTDRSHRTTGGAPNERARLGRERVDPTPLSHEDLELAPFGLRIALVEGDHFRAILADCGNLGTVLDDPAVASNDQPTSSGHDWDPVSIENRWRKDWAGQPFALVEHYAWITWIRDVVAEGTEQLAEAKQIGVNVEPDISRPGGHAAASCASS
jgi:hypothetical protein